MKQRNYKWLIVLISMSFVGLLVIQFYWTLKVLEHASTEFDRNVNKAFHTLNNELEKNEAAYFYSKHIRKKGLGGNDSVAGEHTSENRQWKGKEQVDSIKAKVKAGIAKNIESLIIENNKNDKVVFKQKIRFETDSSHTEQFIEFDVSDSGDIEHNIEESIERKSRELEYIFIEMLSTEEHPVEKAVKEEIMDSLIYQALAKNGITTKFGYRVLRHDQKDSTQILIEQEPVIGQGDYRDYLLPGLRDSREFEIVLSFPNKTLLLAGSIWVLLAASLILIAILVFAFYYSIHSLIRQRKVAELKNDFISNMTHELKTPITSINLACETLKDPGFAHSGRDINKYVGIISDENRRLKALVNNVLDSSFIESDELKLSISKFNVIDLMHEVSTRFYVLLEKLNGKISVSPNTGEILLEADRFHFGNVIYNLVDNAIKYANNAPEISIELSVQKDFLYIKVRDNGIGISKIDQSKIFDKFYRVSKGNVHDVKGFGLGLNYVKRIIELHHGTVSVQSDSTGSTFTIKLPLGYE